jgi:hypothetical protein
MPYQNRVDPFGQILAVHSRGAWMGNRGVLVNEARQLAAQWRLKRWITCVLSFKERWRPVYTPKRYTELFFLDEATSFSAGHRPCAECRRERYNEFRLTWSNSNRRLSNGKLLKAEEMDEHLHVQRVRLDGAKVVYESQLGELPAGTFVSRDGAAHLVWHNQLLPWSFDGYSAAVSNVATGEMVQVLTPVSIVNMYSSGFVPQVHESATNRALTI